MGDTFEMSNLLMVRTLPFGIGGTAQRVTSLVDTKHGLPRTLEVGSTSGVRVS